MDHVLDNPVWNALNSGNKPLAQGHGDIRYFDAEVSPFVGFAHNTEAHFAALHQQIQHDKPLIFVSTIELEIPAIWKVIRFIPGFQMVFDNDVALTDSKPRLLPLTLAHVPQMLALTKLTNPGPFASQTIQFGHYAGIFDGEKLVAMAGQRLHAYNYAEVSAVCTHPDYLGRGYARQVLQYQIQRIRQANEIPYLHVRDDNYRAIKVYHHLGFKTRTQVYFYVMVKQ